MPAFALNEFRYCEHVISHVVRASVDSKATRNKWHKAHMKETATTQGASKIYRIYHQTLNRPEERYEITR
jgi:hypothetical protein